VEDVTVFGIWTILKALSTLAMVGDSSSSMNALNATEKLALFG